MQVQNSRRSILLAAAVAAGLANFANAAGNTWNGTTGNWSDGTKWSSAAAPVATDNLVFPTGAYTATNDIAGVVVADITSQASTLALGAGGGTASFMHLRSGTTGISGGLFNLVSQGSLGINGTPVGMQSLVVGRDSGDAATFNITGGAVVDANNIYAGLNTGSSGTITVSGPGSQLNGTRHAISAFNPGNIRDFTLGRLGVNRGTANYFVDDGGQINSLSFEPRSAGGVANMTIGGSGAASSANFGQVLLGRNTTGFTTSGQITINNGGTLRAIFQEAVGVSSAGTFTPTTTAGIIVLGTATAAGQAGGTGTVTVNAGGFINCENQLQAGLNSTTALGVFNFNGGTATVAGASFMGLANGAIGRMNISNGGQVTTLGTMLVGSPTADSLFALNGEMNVSGAGSLLDVPQLNMSFNGSATSHLRGGNSSATVSGGGSIVSLNGAVIGGRAGTAVLNVTGTGSSFSTGGDILMGMTGGTATVNMTVSAGASAAVAGNFALGWAFGDSVETGGSASATIDNASMDVGAGGAGSTLVGFGSAGNGGVTSSGTLSVLNGGTFTTHSNFASANGLGGTATILIDDATFVAADDVGATQFVLSDTGADSIGNQAVGGNTVMTIRNGSTATIATAIFSSPDLTGFSGVSTINVGTASILANNGTGGAFIGVNGGSVAGNSTVNINDDGTMDYLNGVIRVGGVSTLNIGNAPGSFGGFVSHNGGILLVDGRTNLRSGVIFGSELEVSDGGSLVAFQQNTPGNNGNVNSLIVTGTITTNATGVVDMGDNDMVVAFQPQSEVVAQLVAGRGPGDWSGTNGITSSSANTRPSGNTTLGIMSGADYQSIYGAGAVFEGYTTDGTETALIKYTYYGDTDFNGIVDFDDYVRIDGGFNGGLTGWINGDFDYNGFVDFDDYVLIDNAFNTQNETLASALEIISRNLGDLSQASAELNVLAATDPAFGILAGRLDSMGADYAAGFLGAAGFGAMSAVPEPASIGLIALAGAGMIRRRRRA